MTQNSTGGGYAGRDCNVDWDGKIDFLDTTCHNGREQRRKENTESENGLQNSCVTRYRLAQ